MSSGSKKKFFARECRDCGEIMPVKEKICYCQGSVTTVSLPLDKKDKASSYYIRRQLFRIRNRYE